jgi:hypothetical protein
MPIKNVTEDRRKQLSRDLLHIVLKDFHHSAEAVLFPWRCYFLDEEVVDIIKDHLRKASPTVDVAVVDDFVIRNSLRASLVDIYGHLDWPVSESERDAIMVSAPGFSPDELHAIVSIGTQYGRLHGSGACLLYSQTNSVWTKQRELTSWIS